MKSLFSKRGETIESELPVKSMPENLSETLSETLAETTVKTLQTGPSVINVSLLSESLKRAAFHGNNEMVEELLGRQIPDHAIQESLLIAVNSDHPTTVSIILNHATNLPSEVLYSLIRKVVRSGNTKMVEAIVSSKKCTSSIVTPDVLSIACESGMIDIVVLLLSKCTPSNQNIYVCIQHAQWEIHQLLLTHLGIHLT